MKELKDGDDLDFKIALLTLANVMLVKSENIDERTAIRQFFIDNSIVNILEV